MQTRYPIRAVAKITGISLDTLRAWERRYQAVVPERTDRGRQYEAEHIDRLLLLQQLVQRGHAIGSIAAKPDEELLRLRAAQPSQPKREPSPDLIATALTAIGNYDSDAAGQELDRLATFLSPRDLVYQVVIPLMREVGSRWHDGIFGAAQEHLTSQILRSLLGSMMRLFRKSNASMKLILATPSGESHEFGILASAMLASMAGFETVYLGGSLPAHEIAKAARHVSACAVVLGITVPTDSTASEIRQIAAALPESCELWIGGAGVEGLETSGLGRKVVVLSDLPSLEHECHRWEQAA